ncbi:MULTISPECIES: FtsX-like permease family protein [Colwellia]|uniref:Macrolide export ATP-binding/permease protein MacB 1 n=1 Tax=Colwellia marinimaniae TaxID=1513592 RepID=A0ABQ0MQC5_9GAMM|nr:MULTISPECIES: FtsX-like permease family protein [Colwellia]GAW94555.1 macrolide export ATP-binding/permease protein MacB 1 [Colwellia marinimaniae]
MSLLKKALYQGITRVFSLPRLSVPLILTLGLTLGAVLSVISIASTLLYQPLQGVKNEASLQTFDYRFNMSDTLSVSYWNMNRLVDFSEHFADVGEWAGIAPSEQDVIVNNTTFATTRYDASSNIISVLGSQLLLGDDVTIESPEKYVWISASLWQNAFAGIKSVIGKQITMTNKNYIIAGVIEDVMAIKSNQVILAQQVWFIANLTKIKAQKDNVGNISNELDNLILKSANGQAQLPSQAEVDAWLADYVSRNVDGEQVQMFMDFISNTNKVAKASSYRSNMLGETEGLLIALFAAVIGLLLMATLNLLNLFIAHYQGRTKEFAIQISLGASLTKIRLMVLLENLPSFVLAAITGLLVTGWAIRSLPLIAGDSLPMMDAIAIDSTTVLAAMAIILALSVLFSALALVDIDKQALSNNLNSSGKGIQAQSNQWLSRVLMVLQLSIASILLTASVMIAMQSYQAVYQDLGYELGNSYEIAMTVSDEEYVTQLNSFDDYGKSETKQLLDDLSRLIEQQVPNSQVIAPNYGPLSSSLRINAFLDEASGQRVIHQIKTLGAKYFSTFSIPMLAGANVSQAQIDNDEDRIVIDEYMAKLLFSELTYQEVIGKTIQMSADNSTPPSIVTGIVANTLSQTGIADPIGLPAIYSHRVRPGTTIQFTVMLPEGATVTAAMLASEVKRQFPRLTNVTVESLADVLQRQTLNQRLSLWIVLAMTALTLFLAAIGVAGLTQMTTNHRKYELAVRMATGAKQATLVKFILKDALAMLVIGLGLGFIISVFGYAKISQNLAMLPDFNWLAMATLDAALVIIVILSVIMPAWRVISSDPMQALREE